MSELCWQLWLIGPLVGLVGMFAGGYWGVGCSWLIVPVMLLAGLTPMEAVGIALLQMVPSILPTVVRTAGEISWKKQELGRAILLPMAVGALLTSFTGQGINLWMYRIFGDAGLLVLFTAVMIFIGLQTLLSTAAEADSPNRTFSSRQTVCAWLAGLATGVFSSVLGVGGAVLMRPTLASGFKVSERDTSVSIRILLLVTTLAGGMNYLFADGNFQWRIITVTLLIAAGGMIGFPFGVKLHNLVEKNGYARHIHKSFSLIALIVVSGTLLKLFHQQIASRILMIVFAVLLLTYLLLFGRYCQTHPRR